MNLTVAIISGSAFLAIFLYDHLISKKHPNRNIGFFKDTENIALLFLLVLFSGLVGAVLSMDQFTHVFANVGFSDVTGYDTSRALLFGGATHKLLNGKPVEAENVGSDDTDLSLVTLPVWRKFREWRNS